MLTFAPDKATSVTLILNYQRDPESGSYSGVPVYGSALPNPFGVLPVDFNTSEPAYEAFDRTQKSATILFRHDLNDRLSWTTNARYLAIGLHYRQIYGSGYVTRGTGANANSDLSTLQRGGGGSDEAFQTFTIDNHLVGKLDTGPVKHTILGGVDWQHNRGENYQAFYTGNANPVFNIPNLDLFAPVYGVPLPTFPIDQTHNYTKRDQVGVYLQDQIAIGGLQLIASGRWDTYNQTTQNWVTNRATRLNQTAFTTRLGALYETKIGLSPFVSYSRASSRRRAAPGTAATSSPSPAANMRRAEISAARYDRLVHPVRLRPAPPQRAGRRSACGHRQYPQQFAGADRRRCRCAGSNWTGAARSPPASTWSSPPPITTPMSGRARPWSAPATR